MGLLIALAFAANAFAAEQTALPGVPHCKQVPVRMADDVDSATAQPGDFFHFKTILPLTSGHTILIPAGTMGYGIVAVASSAGREGRAGTLVLEPRYLQLPSGTKLGVVLDHNVGDLERSGASGGMPGYLGAIPVPVVGAAIGIFNYFHHGQNILVKRGTVFTVFPSDDPSTEVCQRSG